METLKGLAVVVIVGVSVGGWWFSQQHKDEFNEYIVPLRPTLTAIGDLVNRVAEAPDDEARTKIAGWIAEAKALEEKVIAATPKDEEVAAIHVHLVAHVTATHRALVAIGQILDGDEGAVATRDARIAEKDASLNAFMAARDAYLKRHDLTLEE